MDKANSRTKAAERPAGRAPALNFPGEIDVDAPMASRLGDAIKLAISSDPGRITLTVARRKRVVTLLAAGLTIGQAGIAVGLSGSALRAERLRNPDWDEACALAIEIGQASNNENAEQRLLAIGLFGAASSMATVKALESYLSANDSRYKRPAGRAIPKLELSQTEPDGSKRTITASHSLIAD